MRKLYIICLLAICLMGADKARAQSEAAFYTSMGSFTVKLTDSLTPVTVDSFIARVSEKFYDGLIFHRVIDGFMIQGGDPNGDGTGGPGYTLPDEFHPSLKNITKALAMANAGPNTSGCQFYINLVTNNYLNNKYTVFGMVTTNFSVVQSIGKVATDTSNDRPLTDVVIDSIRITKFPTAVADLGGFKAGSIYPNPSRGVFNIDLPAIATKVEIVNMRGQAVYAAEAKGTLKVNLTAYAPGLYVVRLANMHGKTEHRVIVQ